MKRALVLAGGGARGSYQAGVLQYLWEKKWMPDLICGSSVGALNTVAFSSGITPEQLAQIWLTQRHRDIFRTSFLKFIMSFFPYQNYHPAVSPRPLKTLIEKIIDFESLRKSKIETIITAVNIRTSQIAYFSKKVITRQHLLASAAMPLMCSWQSIDGEFYWDGGVIDNVPILPALASSADEIIVVMLSPVGIFKQVPPQSSYKTMELVFEQSLVGSFNTILAERFWPMALPSGTFKSPMPRFIEKINGKTKLAMVAPVEMLGFKSLFNFSKKQAKRLLKEGYQDAKMQLSQFI